MLFSFLVSGLRGVRDFASGVIRLTVCPEVGDGDVDLFVGEGAFKVLEDGLEEVDADLACGGGDAVVGGLVDPGGDALGFARFDPVGEVGGDGARLEALDDGDGLDGLAPIEVLEAFAFLWRDGAGLVGSFVAGLPGAGAGVKGEVALCAPCCDVGDEGVAEGFEFLDADAFDGGHGCFGGGSDGGEFAEGVVVEDDIGGDASVFGEAAAEAAEGIEEGEFVGREGDFFVDDCAFDGVVWCEERDLTVADKDIAGVGAEGEGGVLAGVAGEKLLVDELVDVAGEGWFGDVVEEVVGGELVVAPVEDFLGA